MILISSCIPFGPINWWAHLLESECLIIDRSEYYEKISYRNRYYIAGPNNPIMLSMPLLMGRNQSTLMPEVALHNDAQWGIQHYKTLCTVYKKSAFFEYYQPDLERLFKTEFTYLYEFNLASIQWVVKMLKLKLDISFADTYLPSYPESTHCDLRSLKPAINQNKFSFFPHYYQLFEAQIGFQPNLSILDLLFSEGPNTAKWLRENIQHLAI